jgi:hypothetical protein
MAVDVNAGGGRSDGAAWDEMQERFFAEEKRRHQREDDDHEADFVQRSATLTVRLESLLREKTGLERKLRAVTEQMAMAEDELGQLKDGYHREATRRRVERSNDKDRVRSQFEARRAEGPLDTDLVNQLRRVGPTLRAPPLTEEDAIIHQDLTGAEVVDSDGDLIGPIKKIPASNHWIEIMLDLDVKRKVVIRPARKFTKANLDVIYEKNDHKCSKWIACMIQATGIDQAPPCASCHASLTSDSVFAGPFATCVKAQGSEFVKCGNCEWNKTPCHGSGPDPSSHEVNMEMDSGRPDMPAVNTIVHRPLAPSSGIPSLPPSASTAPMPVMARAGNTWDSGPSWQPANSPYAAGSPAAAAVTAANSPAASDDTPELTEPEKEALLKPPVNFQHNGHVYTYPEFMEGVPLEKIDTSHPYWELTWKEPMQTTQRVLASYEEKHAEALRKDIKNNKFLLGRQVRRGHTIMKFLRDGSISPYQLVSKKYMVPGLVTYDTLFRLVNTIEELEKFKIGVPPVDWLRHRLYEIMLEQGDKFNISKVVKDLYHDEKLGKLRKLRGFGNIGRPSGGKDVGPRARRRDSGNTPTRPYRKKAKIAQPGGSTEAHQSPLRSGVTPGGRPGRPGPAPSQTLETAEDEAFTDTDSLSGEGIYKNDFRLASIRTAQYMAKENADMRVYWHSEGGEIDVQVCTEKRNVWLACMPPIDFMATFQDCLEVGYHPDSLNVLVRMRSPHSPGDTVEIAALLARERTKKRLLDEFRENDVSCQIKSYVLIPRAPTRTVSVET